MLQREVAWPESYSSAEHYAAEPEASNWIHVMRSLRLHFWLRKILHDVTVSLEGVLVARVKDFLFFFTRPVISSLTNFFQMYVPVFPYEAAAVVRVVWCLSLHYTHWKEFKDAYSRISNAKYLRKDEIELFWRFTWAPVLFLRTRPSSLFLNCCWASYELRINDLDFKHRLRNPNFFSKKFVARSETAPSDNLSRLLSSSSSTPSIKSCQLTSLLDIENSFLTGTVVHCHVHERNSVLVSDIKTSFCVAMVAMGICIIVSSYSTLGI